MSDYRQVLLNLIESARKAGVPPSRMSQKMLEILATDPLIPEAILKQISSRKKYIEKLAGDGQTEACYDEIAQMIKLAEPFF